VGRRVERIGRWSSPGRLADAHACEPWPLGDAVPVRPFRRTDAVRPHVHTMTSPDAMKTLILEAFAAKMDAVRQLLVCRRGVEVHLVQLRREVADGATPTAAQTAAARVALSRLAMWNAAGEAATAALYHDMFEWMDEQYADLDFVLTDMEGHSAMRWAEWIRARILELSPPLT